MSLNWDQAHIELSKKLDSSVVSQRRGVGTQTFDYLESHYVIREANKIFGFDGWNSRTVSLSPACEATETKNGKYKIAYIAIVEVTVDGVVRQGTGYGDATAADIVSIHEMAAKEAESDAQKRALRTFGDRFGLALYDKKREHVIDVEQERQKLRAAFATIKTCLQGAKSSKDVKAIMKKYSTEMLELANDQKEAHDILINLEQERIASFELQESDIA